MPQVPQRFLPGNRNKIRAAVLTASSVLGVSNKVLQLPTARVGTGQAVLEGEYTGAEQADYDIEILDDSADEALVSTPIFTGIGSGSLTAIVATGAAQTYTLECREVGTESTRASLSIEGQTLRAVVTGTPGNAVNLTVDGSALVFAATAYSLLADLPAGSGSAAQPMSGPGFDWDASALDPNGTIPAGAHRVAFGDDQVVYLSYKEYIANAWQYRLVPALAREVPKGTAIKFVTGARTLALSNGIATETFPDVITAYDALNAIKSGSALVTVEGVVANDRTPIGQAAREFALRTDAHAEVSTGSGSKYATGFVDVTVRSNAPTELVTATCYAVSANEHPLAALGRERWELKGSLSGNLGTIITGALFSGPKFGLRVPVKLPPGFGAPKGRFSVSAINYASRTVGDPPPICPVALSLGPEAVDETITLTYRTRATGNCQCAAMPVPNLSTTCLGNPQEGGATMAYQEDTRERLRDLYAWYADTVRSNSVWAQHLFDNGAVFPNPTASSIVEDFLTQPQAHYSVGFAARSLRDIVDLMATTLLQVDPLETGTGLPRADGLDAWDSAFAELQDDVATAEGESVVTVTATAQEDLAAGNAVLYYTDEVGDFKCRLYVSAIATIVFGRLGFVTADVASGDPASIHTSGIFAGTPGSFSVGTRYKAADGGDWVEDSFGGAVAISATELVIPSAVGGTTDSIGTWLVSMPSPRYESRMQHVIVSAGLDPLGGADANTLRSGDGCWRDYGDAAWWEAVGSVKGGYAPLFSNRPGYSCRANAQGVFFSTHEWALQLNIKCPEDLLDGDQVVLVIADASWGATYQPGDVLTLPVIAAGPLYLSGGATGDPTQRWFVGASVDGALALYAFNPDAPAAYVAAGITFRLVQGGIVYAVGDKFVFVVESGHYRWRKNGGSWDGSSPPLAISATPDVFDAGLTLAFLTGAARSFVAGDVFRFRALQPWAVSNLQSAKPQTVWKWSGATATLVCDLGSEVALDLVALLHELPEGATITLEGGTVPDVYTWTETLAWRAKSLWQELAQSARYLRFSFAAAAGGSVRYAWVGASLATELTADFHPRDSYNAARPSSPLLQGARYLGRTVSGTVVWSVLYEADVAELRAMVDDAKARNDEPILFVPQVTRTTEPMLYALIDADDIEYVDAHGYQPNAGRARNLSATLPLRGVWQ